MFIRVELIIISVNNMQKAMFAELNPVYIVMGISIASGIQAVNRQANTAVAQAFTPHQLNSKRRNVPSIKLEKWLPRCRDRPVLRIGIDEADIQSEIDTLKTIVDALNRLCVMPKQGDSKVGKTHISTAVIGTRGGVGASTLATSLAWLFSAEHKLPTALLDLDIHFGTGALSLDLEPGRGLTDAIENPSRIDGLFIERAMIRANDHLAILSAEAPINAPLLTDGSAFVQLEEEFRQAFEMTVIDLPRNMLINFPHLLTEVNVVVLATEMTLASARDAIRLLSWLKTNAGHVKVLVVANKVQQGVGEISKADFEASIERKINFSVPYDIKAGINAAKLGQTFAEANRMSKAGGSMREIANAVIGATDSDDDNGLKPAKKSLLGKLDLKAMLSNKKSKPAMAGAPAA